KPTPSVYPLVSRRVVGICAVAFRNIFDLGSRLSEFLSSLRPRTLAWSASAAAVVILVQAAVITTVLVKEQGEPSGPFPEPLAIPQYAERPSALAPSRLRLDEEIAALVAGGRQLMIAGDISNARLLLQQAAEAGNATAALELGATYDPFILQETQDKKLPRPGGAVFAEPTVSAVAEVAMGKAWYGRARGLGSAGAAGRAA